MRRENSDGKVGDREERRTRKKKRTKRKTVINERKGETKSERGRRSMRGKNNQTDGWMKK